MTTQDYFAAPGRETTEGRVYTVTGSDWDEVGATEASERIVVNMGPQHPSGRVASRKTYRQAPERRSPNCCGRCAHGCRSTTGCLPVSQSGRPDCARPAASTCPRASHLVSRDQCCGPPVCPGTYAKRF